MAEFSDDVLHAAMARLREELLPQTNRTVARHELESAQREISRLERELEARPTEEEAKTIARKAAEDVFASLGFDMDPTHRGETTSRVVWLMGLRPGVRGMLTAIFAALMTVVAGLTVSIVSGMWKK